MEISIRHAAAMFALAFITLASTAEAQIGETGKLRLTGGVNSVLARLAPMHRDIITK